jgi:flagellar operon protein
MIIHEHIYQNISEEGGGMKNIPIGGLSPGQIKPTGNKTEFLRRPGPQKLDFQRQFRNSLQRLESLQFSDHAVKRLMDRGVELTADNAQRLVDAVETAREKGARDSLVLLDRLAFVVSVSNKTVITACDMNGLKERIFTKIDSAVLG